MKGLKGSIRIRIILFVCVIFAVVFGTFFIINMQNQNSIITDLYNQSIDEVQTTFARNVEYIMLQGENEKIQPLIEEMHQEKMVSEVSIIDADGIVARSTNHAIVGKHDTDLLWNTILKNGNDTIITTEQNNEPVVISYRAFTNKPECTDCHDSSERTLGGLKVVKSKLEMANRQNASFWFTLMIGILGSLVIVLGILIIQNRWIFNPLKTVGIQLEHASNGDINQTIAYTAKDEIGRLCGSIENLISYIRGMAEASGEIADGNLTIEVNPKSDRDVLGISFNKMIQNLNDIIQNLTDNTSELTSTAGEIAAASEQSSRGAKEQTGQVNQIATAIEQMSATIIETSRNSGDASKAAQQASETASSGRDVVAQTIQGMQAIATVVRDSATNISKLAESASQIGEIISVIDDIADQTNLLALNAAIEAARAGDQGRGFAVVADEVRKLAERTGKATGEITDMIKGIQDETTQAVRSMETGITEVDKGRELADRAGQSLGQIADMSHQVLQMVEQIATASEEQAVASEEIAKNVDYITNIVKESEISFEQTASGAEQLNVQADRLRGMINKFDIKGGKLEMFKIAQNDHRLYMKRLKNVLDGKTSKDDFSNSTHQTCRFGKWYSADAVAQFGNLSSYNKIDQPHRDVHNYANQAVEAYARDDYENAHKLYEQALAATKLVIKYSEEAYHEAKRMSQTV